MNLIETLRQLKVESGYTFIHMNAENDKDYLSIEIRDKGDFTDAFFGRPAMPTAEERQEKIVEDLEKATEEGHYVKCPRCGKSFFTTKNERVRPDCKKESRDRAMAKYKSKQDKLSEAAKEIVRLGDENA